jgi:hypothetical protein
MNKRGGFFSLIIGYFVFLAIFFLVIAGWVNSIIAVYGPNICNYEGVSCFLFSWLNLWIFLAATLGTMAGVAFYAVS